MNNSTTPESLNLANSERLAALAKQRIAGFTQTMMKKPEQFSPGHFPIYLRGGDGALVTDVDGNTYIDFIGGLAANSLGHNHPAVTQAITENLSAGLLHSLPAPVETQAANTIAEMIPGADMVRFFKTGADANSAAIRLARFLSHKEEIVTIGYNGWHDQFMFDTPGVPKALEALTHRMPLITENQESPVLELLRARSDKIAAVLLALPYNRKLKPTFVQALRDVCSQKNIVFIWDEVMTGFRLALGGAQEYFGVSADLVTLSKALAAGMPLSAVCGRREFMQEMEKLQVSTTFGGELLSLHVCIAALNEYRQSNTIEHIAQLGSRLKSEVNQISALLESPLKVVGYDPIPMFLFSPDPQQHIQFASPFLAEMAKRGVLLRREVNFISGAHTEAQIDTTVSAVRESLIAMKEQGLFAASKELQEG